MQPQNASSPSPTPDRGGLGKIQIQESKECTVSFEIFNANTLQEKKIYIKGKKQEKR